MQVELTARWHQVFPGSHVGLLSVANVDNHKRSTPLDDRKLEVEAELRRKYGGLSRTELQELEVLRAYREYYRRFDQTYHVQSQLESVVHKNKSLPNVSPLVDANFVAELQSLVLTAGHDADLLELPVRIDATRGGEAFEQMNGTARTLKPNDMMMLDASGIVTCSTWAFISSSGAASTCTSVAWPDWMTPSLPATHGRVVPCSRV